jgi:trehalose/maltose hydrolase-like predicted phosphorylase
MRGASAPDGSEASARAKSGGLNKRPTPLSDRASPYRARRKRRRRPAGETLADLMGSASDPEWTLQDAGYQPALEHEVESRFALSNGFLGIRSSLEQPTRASRPRTYVAGLFGPPSVGTAGRALVPAPDWARLSLALDGNPLTLEAGHALAHSRTLDLRRGLLITSWRERLASGCTVQLRTLRLASLADRHLALQLAQIETEQPADASLEAGVETPVQALVPEQVNTRASVWRTSDAKHRLAIATDYRLHIGRRSISQSAGGGAPSRWSWPSKPGVQAVFASLVAVARDGRGIRDVQNKALASLRRARRVGLKRVVGDHARAWEERWSNSDVVIRGDPSAQRALRFALYHLNSAANPGDEHASIAARGLTGDAYLGHVFWDTEMFLLPFYTLTWPAAARSLLMYRYQTLPAARAKAARLGYRGALYAWESADTGEETTPRFAVGQDGKVVPIRSGTDEQHISADIAYAVWQYWDATRDVGFLLGAGAEILLETTRFWASRATLETDGRYHIRGVIGPDEYHEGVDDDAYTNMMARWNLECGQEIARLLRARWPRQWASFRQRLKISTKELAEWSDVAERLAGAQPEVTEVLEQFTGFFGLEPLDLAAYEPHEAPMDVVLGPERVRRSQVIKQADVIMLLALLWNRFSTDARMTNFRYYEPRCGHGSSLSPPIHGLVAARLGKTSLALRYFRETGAIDLDDTMGNAAGGVHMGALGGLWQATVFGFAGLSLTNDGIALDPHLPQDWKELCFPMKWRGRSLTVRIAGEPLTVEVRSQSGRPLVVQVGKSRHKLGRGEIWTCRLGAKESRRKEVP